MISSFYFGCRDTYIEVREMGRVSNSSTRAGKSCIWSRASRRKLHVSSYFSLKSRVCLSRVTFTVNPNRKADQKLHRASCKDVVNKKTRDQPLRGFNGNLGIGSHPLRQ